MLGLVLLFDCVVVGDFIIEATVGDWDEGDSVGEIERLLLGVRIGDWLGNLLGEIVGVFTGAWVGEFRGALLGLEVVGELVGVSVYAPG